MSIRRTLFAACLCLSSFAPAFAQSAHFGTAAKFEGYSAGDPVNVLLTGHGHVRGTITAIDEDSVSILPKHAATPETIAFSSIRGVHDRSSLGSRFQMGPCVGPVTLAIASPFIVVNYLIGR